MSFENRSNNEDLEHQSIERAVERARDKIARELRERFKENEIDVTAERKFVEDLWGASTKAEVFYLTTEEAEALGHELEARGFDVAIEDAGLYAPELNLCFIRKDASVVSGFDNFYARRIAVHELTHATQGKQGYTFSPEQFKPGDTIISEAESDNDERRYQLAKPRIGSVVLNSTHHYGQFLEEAVAVYTDAQWVSQQFQIGNTPERLVRAYKNLSAKFDPRFPEKTKVITGQEVEMPASFIYITDSGEVGVNSQLSAAAGLRLLIKEDPQLFEEIKKSRQGSVEALRAIPRRINALLGAGAYSFLQKRDIAEDEDSYYLRCYRFIKDKLVEAEASSKK